MINPASTPRSLEARRRAVVDALHRLQSEPLPVDPLVRRVQQLSDRVDRLESVIELIRDGDDEPAPIALHGEAYPADRGLEVPPLDVPRRSSPAFDVLLGGPTS